MSEGATISTKDADCSIIRAMSQTQECQEMGITYFCTTIRKYNKFLDSSVIWRKFSWSSP